MSETSYLHHLHDIARGDVDGLKKAQESYGDSWKQRGGVGAFMMLARKWDRIERRMEQRPLVEVDGGPVGVSDFPGDRWDIFAHVRADDRAEGVIDDVRDLRRYLLLVEAECRAQGLDAATTTHRDNG